MNITNRHNKNIEDMKYIETYTEQEVKDLLDKFLLPDGSINRSINLISKFSNSAFLKNYLNKRYPGLKTADQLWRITGNDPGKCVVCGSETKYFKIKEVEGKYYPAYRSTCSKKCTSEQIKIDIKLGKRPSFTKEDGISVLDRYRKKYSEEEAIEKWNEWRNKQKIIYENRSAEWKENFKKAGPATAKKKLKGTRLLDIYINKYGEDLGKIKYEEAFAKQKRIMQENFTGENNHQFGKPSSHKSGRGWSGYYVLDNNKNIFFRSLLELSFIINVLEKYNIKWESGELKKFKISYIINNKHRNYFPDFITNNSIIEIKPSSLANTTENLLKREAAVRLSLKEGRTYKIFSEKDFKQLSFDELVSLHDSKKIIFLDRIEEKYKACFEKGKFPYKYTNVDGNLNIDLKSL